MRHFLNQSGSISAPMIAFLSMGVMGVAVKNEYQRISNDIHSNVIEQAVENAHNDNLAAAAYLGAALEPGPSNNPLLKINGLQLTGTGHKHLQVHNGQGLVPRPDFSNAQTQTVKNLFDGKPISDPNLAHKTQLTIVKTEIVPGALKKHVYVRARSIAVHGDRSYYPVSTMFKLTVDLPPPPPPPPPPPSFPPSSGSGSSGGGGCG